MGVSHGRTVGEPMKKTSVIAVLLGGFVWVGAGVAAGQTPDSAKAAAGKALFEQTKCTMCHGENAHGDKNGKLSLVGVGQKLLTEDIRKWITSPAEMTAKLPKKPVIQMIKFPLTDPQVDTLVAYVQSLKK